MNAQTVPNEEYRRKGLLSRIWESVCGTETDYEDEEAEEIEAVTTSAAAPLRLSTSLGGRIAIRKNAATFEDAKVAADGLKNGEQQIVNLERAPPHMAERIIDFLNGAIWALDGSVERVGEKVYMYVPANVVVEVDSGATTGGPAARSAYPE